jgi:hypothetical protein
VNRLASSDHAEKQLGLPGTSDPYGNIEKPTGRRGDNNVLPWGLEQSGESSRVFGTSKPGTTTHTKDGVTLNNSGRAKDDPVIIPLLAVGPKRGSKDEYGNDALDRVILAGSARMSTDTQKNNNN